ncbi:ribosomal RNA processing protein 36 homolog isoform X1 [Mucor ambiguus]|uniref:rRNA biogenesis protein RRP36 n=1 Tax=Mucor ambiguus TaxID=91626 RepID=A0A0C9MUD0_9FUNG|nr:ribosomal RNA processing protein 36 homolog isoform X1 [Mucor ambiguus]
MVIKKRQQYEESESEQEEEYTYANDSQDEDDEELEQSEEEGDENNEDEEDEEEYKAAQLAKIKRDLAHVSFEQLADLKGKMGEKGFVKDEKKKISKDQILKDLKGAVGKLKKTNKVKLTKQDMKRESKHRPMEVSSKRAVGRHRDVVQLQAEKRRDPRFDKLSGQLNQDLFEKSYGFLNDYKKSEMEMLRESIKKEQDEEKQEHMKGLLLKMVSADKQEQERKRKQALLRDRKKQESELVKQGKTPYFLKRSEKRKLDLMDRYEKLGAKSVDRILEKRRKRNTTKDRKHLPFNKRRSAAE